MQNQIRPMKVLLIEDQLGHRLSLMKVLSRFKAEIDSAVTFGRARDLVALKVYDLVISELLLSHCPEIQGDGMQFWYYFQALHPSVPIFLIADEVTRMTTEMFLHGSMKPPILNKPVNEAALKHLIEREVMAFLKIA